MLHHALRSRVRPPITYVGSATATSGYTLTLPGGLLPGDVVVVASYSDNGTPNQPTGYTTIAYGRALVEVGYYFSYKVMPATPDGYVNGLTSIDAGNISVAVVFRGVQSGTVLDVTTPGISSGSGGSYPQTPAITPVTPGAMIVLLACLDDDACASATTPPSGYTLALAFDRNTTTTGTIMIAYKRLGTAGTDTPGSFGTGGAIDHFAGATIALRPES
jgi:hypothetical protein